MAENPSFNGEVITESELQTTPLEPNRETFLSEVHSHHWIIETPDGHKHSLGICKFCGEENMFKNWLEETDFTMPSERKFNI